MSLKAPKPAQTTQGQVSPAPGRGAVRPPSSTCPSPDDFHGDPNMAIAADLAESASATASVLMSSGVQEALAVRPPGLELLAVFSSTQPLPMSDANAITLCEYHDVSLVQAEEPQIRGRWDWSDREGHNASDSSLATKEEAAQDVVKNLELEFPVATGASGVKNNDAECAPGLRSCEPKAKIINAYHGTPFGFSEFIERPSGIHFGNYDQAAHAATIKLGKLPLKVFESLEEDEHGWRGRMYKVELRLERTKRVDDARTPANWAREIRKATAEGFDSLVYKNDYEGKDAKDSYVVFSASQIKILGLD